MEVGEESDSEEIFVHPDDPVPWFPEQESPSPTSSAEKKLRLKRRKRCGECGPCQIKTNCGTCAYCVRRSVLKQSCIYRKCIYLRKAVRRPSRKEEKRAHKQQSDLLGETEKCYPYESLSPNADQQCYELQSPPTEGVYPVNLIQVGHSSEAEDDKSSPEAEAYIAEARRRVEEEMDCQENVNGESIVIEPVSTSDDSPEQAARSPTCSPKRRRQISPVPLARITHTPPHPFYEISTSEALNPHLVNALRTPTVRDQDRDIVSKENPKVTSPSDEPSDKLSDKPSGSSGPGTSVISKPIHELGTSDKRTTDTVEGCGQSNPRPPSHNVVNSSSVSSSSSVHPASSPCISSSPHPSAILPSISRPFPCNTPNSTVFTNPIQSLNSTYSSMRSGPFISPPNVTVGRLGGFTPTHGSTHKSALWPERMGSSHPLNLSRNPYPHHSPGPCPEVPRSPSAPIWSPALPPCPYPPNSLMRPHFPPGAYPPPHPLAGLDIPTGYPPHPAFPGPPYPYLPSRMEPFGAYPPPPPHAPLFPPERYPLPHPGLYQGGLFPPSVMSSLRHPHEHSVHRVSQAQTPQSETRTPQPEDYSKAVTSKSPKSREISEAERAEVEEYKKYSIFRIQNKQENKPDQGKNIGPSNQQDKEDPKGFDKSKVSGGKNSDEANKTEEAKKSQKVPRCTNETLRKLLSNISSNNNVKNISDNNNAKDGTESQATVIDDDLKSEIRKVSGYCGCNFITIDDLRMQATIRSDGVNNLEIEIPSPDSNKSSPKTCNNSTCQISKSKEMDVSDGSKSLGYDIPKDISNEDSVKLIKVKGTVCLKQDLGDDGVLCLEVQSERVKLVQCVLDDELVNQSKNPKELREYILRFQPSLVQDANRCLSSVNGDDPLDLSSAQASASPSVSKSSSWRSAVSKGSLLFRDEQEPGNSGTFSGQNQRNCSSAPSGGPSLPGQQESPSVYSEESALLRDSYRDSLQTPDFAVRTPSGSENSVNHLDTNSQKTSFGQANHDKPQRSLFNVAGQHCNTSILRNGYLLPPLKSKTDCTSNFVDSGVSGGILPESDATLMNSDYNSANDNCKGSDASVVSEIYGAVGESDKGSEGKDEGDISKGDDDLDAKDVIILGASSQEAMEVENETSDDIDDDDSKCESAIIIEPVEMDCDDSSGDAANPRSEAVSEAETHNENLTESCIDLTDCNNETVSELTNCDKDLPEQCVDLTVSEFETENDKLIETCIDLTDSAPKSPTCEKKLSDLCNSVLRSEKSNFSFSIASICSEIGDASKDHESVDCDTEQSNTGSKNVKSFRNGTCNSVSSTVVASRVPSDVIGHSVKNMLNDSAAVCVNGEKQSEEPVASEINHLRDLLHGRTETAVAQ